MHSIPFPLLQSRLIIASILTFYGDINDVYHLLQITSHKTRAYILNANGLKGFLVPTVTSVLKKALADDELADVTEYQRVDM